MRNGITANNMLPKMRLICVKARRRFLQRSKAFSFNTVILHHCIPRPWMETFLLDNKWLILKPFSFFVCLFCFLQKIHLSQCNVSQVRHGSVQRGCSSFMMPQLSQQLQKKATSNPAKAANTTVHDEPSRAWHLCSRKAIRGIQPLYLTHLHTDTDSLEGLKRWRTSSCANWRIHWREQQDTPTSKSHF